MSYLKVSGTVAAMVTALALAGGAYGDPGKSPNGAPGPAGNPNQPASTPQSDNGPQGPAGNDQGQQKESSSGKSETSHGKSEASHGKSGASQGKSDASHGKSNTSHGDSGGTHTNHANPSPGTPRKGGREDRPAGKITICHATKSVKNPYVEITISVNGLHGHGPAEDPRHHEGSWQDIIPAPAGGCPSTVQQSSGPVTETKTEPTSTPTTTPPTSVALLAAPEVAATAPAGQAVLGAQASGGSEPAGASAPGASKVLGASASGSTPPAAAVAARAEDDASGSLPFTGFELAIVLLAAAAALLGGFALRRATTR
jgi:hypothetical protein